MAQVTNQIVINITKMIAPSGTAESFKLIQEFVDSMRAAGYGIADVELVNIHSRVFEENA